MFERLMPAGACLLLDAQLTVVHVNPAAQHLLAVNTSLLALRRQCLCATGVALALDRALATAARGTRTAIALTRPNRLPLTLRAEPMPAAGRDWVLVTLRDPELDAPDPALLQHLFGLTPTEALVAAGLAQGLDSTELARAMGVQPNTVQSHVKRVLLKSGTRRQSQLVSLILRSAAMPSHPQLAGSARTEAPGLAQTGNDTSERTGHSHHQPATAACGCL